MSNSSSKGKEIILVVLMILAHAALFWFWSKTVPLVAVSEFQNLKQFIPPFAALLVAATCFALAAIFSLTRRTLYVGITLAFATGIIVLPKDELILSLLGGCVLIAWFASHRVHKEIAISRGFSVSKLLRAGLPLYFTAASLAISLLYLGQVDEKRALAAIFPRSLFNIAIEELSTLEMFRSLTGVSGITSELTVDDLLRGLIEKQLQAQGIKRATVPKAEFDSILREQRAELSKRFGLELEGSEKVRAVFYSALTGRIQEFLGPYERYLPLGSAFIFFFALRALTFPLFFIVLVLVFVLIQLLILAKVIRKETITVQVDQLIL